MKRIPVILAFCLALTNAVIKTSAVSRHAFALSETYIIQAHLLNANGDKKNVLTFNLHTSLVHVPLIYFPLFYTP